MWCLIVEEGRGEVRVRELEKWVKITLNSIKKIRKIQVRNIKKNRNVSKNHSYNQKLKKNRELLFIFTSK